MSSTTIYTDEEKQKNYIISRFWERDFDFSAVHEDWQDIFTPETVNELINVLKYNDNVPIYYYVDFYHLFNYNGLYVDGTVHYYPFDFPEYDNPKQLPYDFEFTIDNYYVYSWIREPKEIELFILRANLFHKYLHDLGYEPYTMINSLGLYEGFRTKKNNPINPRYFKTAVIKDYQGKNPDGSTNGLEKFFGIDTSKYTWGIAFSFSGGEEYDKEVIQIKFPRAFQSMGLILLPGEGKPTLPYHYKKIHYVNPKYGYFDGYYSVTEFKGGGYQYNGKPNIKGKMFASGFEVVWFNQSELTITLSYRIIYEDFRVRPSDCCLAKCFGITE